MPKDFLGKKQNVGLNAVAWVVASVESVALFVVFIIHIICSHLALQKEVVFSHSWHFYSTPSRVHSGARLVQPYPRKRQMERQGDIQRKDRQRPRDRET